MPKNIQTISPETTVFVLLSFEGPDVYSTAGGLGTRMTELSEALAIEGYTTHLLFIGDPNQPALEKKYQDKLILKRWSQWVSRYYPNGVYDGENAKLYDYNESVPYHIYEEIVQPALAMHKTVVIMGEDWHTAETMSHTSDILNWHGVRNRVLMLWNLNSLMSLHRINWGRLGFTTTICTVSKYMKHKMWNMGLNPLVIPNGLPERYLIPVDASLVKRMQMSIHQGDMNRIFLFKIGRFDPDKRWMMAIEAVARLKQDGHAVTLVIRGGMEPHGHDVLHHAHELGLTVQDISAPKPSLEQCFEMIENTQSADILNLRFFVPEEVVRVLYASADATLANSGHEPFGLVALEVMAAGGIAVTGSTGEDYAVSFDNAIVTETDDPDEIVGYLLYLQQNPALKEKLRTMGRSTAERFLWKHVIDNLCSKLEYLAQKQGIKAPVPVAVA